MPATVLLNRGGGAVAADRRDRGQGRRGARQGGVEADVELIEGGECAVRCKAIAERGDPLADRRRRRRHDQRRRFGAGRDRRPGSASCRSARSTISRATSAFRRTSTRPRELIADGQRAPRRRRRDERPHLHQQQRDRPLSADGRRPRPAAQAAGPEQAAGDAGRLAADPGAVQPPAADPDRQRREGAGRHAVAVRRQQRLSHRHRRARSAREPRGWRTVRAGDAQEDPARA